MNWIKNNIRLSLAVVLALGLGIGWFLAREGEENKPKASSQTKQGEEIWTCSMHPQIRKNEPGDCPICGMDLIPLKETGASLDPNSLELSKEAIALAKVETIRLQKKKARGTFELNGKIKVNSEYSFVQSSHLEGRIEEMYVQYPGEKVKAGQVIARVYAPDLLSAREELQIAYENRDKRPEFYEATRQKLKAWKLSEQDIDDLIQSTKNTNSFPIRAEKEAVVLNLITQEGDYLKSGQALYKAADLKHLWASFELYESQIAYIRKGDSISFRLEAYPGEERRGEIYYIDPFIDPKTRVAEARVQLNNPDEKLKPEMFLKGRLVFTQAEEQLMVPASAVLWTGKRSLVYLAQRSSNGQIFQAQEVELGPLLGDAYPVLKGLKEGQEIVKEGAFSVDAAAQLAGKRSMMNSSSKGQSSTATKHAHDHSTLHPSGTEKIKLKAEASRQFEIILAEYLKLKEALVEDKPALAQKIGAENAEKWNTLVAALPKTKDQYLRNSLSHWQSIAEHSNLDLQREAFAEISKAIAYSLEEFQWSSDQSYYLQYCPMAFDFKGANWISSEEEIRNPYFGASMLSCGEVQNIYKP